MKKACAIVAVVSFVILSAVFSLAATISPHRSVSSSKKEITENPRAVRKMRHMRHSARLARTRLTVRTTRGRRRYVGEHFYASSYTDSDQTTADVIAGEDPIVRQAAIDALGNMNGTIVAIDPATGRILAMVNQPLALSAGATPCSTIKVPVALAALSEGLITKETKVSLGGGYHMDLTTALAHSNNLYFETVGRKLGFDKYSYYAHQFGLGELAGWNIPGEHLGTFPSSPLAENLGGVGKMCSFGESISMTPLQLGALMSAVANGGTLFYLQHPASQDQAAHFQPKVKRHLDIAPLVPEIATGMEGAVRYGTARSLRGNFSEEQVLGKTGTCSKDGTRFGWFASFANTPNTQYGRIVTVIFLEGGRPTFGPKAAELAGRMYRNLYDHSFFAARTASSSSVPGVSVSR
jgi:penicillin-binding protein 2